MMKLLIPFSLLFCICRAYPEEPRAVSDLALVQVLFRHGDRSPKEPFPTDPNNGYWTKGLGQLTTIGMQQEYELGQYIANRYSGFLNGSYFSENVKCLSATSDRTLMSAYAQLAGLFPPNSEETWNPAIPWQPIPVHAMPSVEDYWLDHDAPCPNYDDLLDEQKDSQEMADLDEYYADLYSLLTEETGTKVNSIFDVSDLYDDLYCDMAHDLTIPDWATPDVLQEMSDCRNLDYVWKSKTLDMQRLRGGPTVWLMVQYMKNKTNDLLPGLELVLLSTHETLVSATLAALGVYNDLMIPYAAALFMELSLQNDQYVVQMFYRNDTTKDPIELILPGCTSPCPYDTFHDLTDPVTPGPDMLSECGVV